MPSRVCYDKAKYHIESVEVEGLPEIHAYIHTGMYLGWLIENNLLDKEFSNDFGREILKFKNKEITAPEFFFQICDGVLIDDILSDEGNEFTSFYFDLEKGEYIYHYEHIMFKELPSVFHVKDTWKNYEIVKEFVSKEYVKWKNQSKKWWEFWK